MRRYMRDRILELLDTVREGAKLGLLDDCAVALTAIGTTLKENLSEGAFTVYEGRLKVDKIDELMQLLENEQEVQREIVFFPYKVSMWDSLESIWLAAKDDPRCFVSVVPIPYYEILNGEAVMHYEGGMYPDYVPVVDWHEYDLSTVMPDVAYIHNLYDDHNLVTMVDSRYFSRNLKKYVCLLVYVPYYVNDERSLSNLASIPVGSSVNIVIAASEIDKKAYREAGVTCDIAALGSPKIDKIINANQGKPLLPPEWDNLSGKKVFFLNTSIGSMLVQSEFYFKKLCLLFDLFKKRDDIALIWRPHPLTETTINAVRPALREQYDKLVSMIRAGSFGVFDESPDMHTAIGISDAYIGDGSSSVVYLYGLTGKPVYILNFKMPIEPEPELREELLKSDIIIWSDETDESREWGISVSINAFYKINLEKATAEFVASFPDEKNIGYLYAPPVKIGFKLFFSPIFARKWAFYDTRNGNWEKCAIPSEAIPKSLNHAVFSAGIACDGAIIFLPGESGIIARYNINSDEFTYHTEMAEVFKERVVNLDWGMVSGYCKAYDMLYISSPQCNIVTELNTKTMEFQFFEVGSKRNRYFQIAFADGRFWLTKYRESGLTPWKEGIVSWDTGTGKVQENTELPVKQGDNKFSGSGFAAVRFAAGSIFAFPCQADAIVKIDSKTGETERFELAPPYNYFERKSPYYLWGDETALPYVMFPRDDKVTALMPYDYSIMTIDLKTGKRGERKKWMVKGIEQLLQSPERVLPTYWSEGAFLTPKEYIEKVLSGKILKFDEDQAAHYRSVNENSNGTCGKKVHEYVMISGKLIQEPNSSS